MQRHAGHSGLERPVHYGCHEFGEDAERVIQARAHPELAQLYHAHLACCRDCQRVHHRLEALYRRPKAPPPLDSFSRDHEFDAIIERTRAAKPGRDRELRRLSAAAGVGMLATVLVTMAAVLALALVFPSFGARLFQPPAAAVVELGTEGPASHYGQHVQIPERHLLGHQSQSFARVIGGDALDLRDASGRSITVDSLPVGTRIATGDQAVQIAFVGRMIANFEAHSVARWTLARPRLVELGLLTGTLAVRYDRRPGDPVLQIRTPSALVRVIGTVFTVAVDGRGETTVSVLRGRVEVLDPDTGRSLAAVEAGFRYEVTSASYRELGRREVAAALPLAELEELEISISSEGELVLEEPARLAGQIPHAWTVPGLSADPQQRTIDRVLSPEGEVAEHPSDKALAVHAPTGAPRDPQAAADSGEAATLALISRQRDRREQVAEHLEHCRELQAEPDTRFKAARCLGDFMQHYGDRPEAVEGLLLLGTLRMDFAHDYQSATRNIEEFLRRAPNHPKAELARYKLVLAAIDAGYIPRALQRARSYLARHPDGQYVGRLLERFPELF